MKKVNLRDLYPDIYKNDYFVEVTEDAVSYTHLDVYKRQLHNKASRYAIMLQRFGRHTPLPTLYYYYMQL